MRHDNTDLNGEELVTDDSPGEDWFKEFFSGAALDLWRQAKTKADTDEECKFLCDTFGTPYIRHLLDVPCGNGRLSLPMVQAGYRVTGVDYCQEFIDEGTEKANSARLKSGNVRFLRGDMRLLKLNESFDGAFCFGNSFGYFDEEGTRDMFTSLGACLNSHSKFVLESIMLAETFLVNGAEREWVRAGDVLMLIENHYNVYERCVDTDYTFIKNGQEQSRKARHWIYTSRELCSMLAGAGFQVIEMFGSLEGEAYSLGSERLILIADKA